MLVVVRVVDVAVAVVVVVDHDGDGSISPPWMLKHHVTFSKN